MENIYKKEKWEEIYLDDALEASKQQIYVSNFGRIRIRNHETDTFRLSDFEFDHGAPFFMYKTRFGTTQMHAVHRAVALTFVEKKDQDHMFCIHKDFNRQNNFYNNLKWVDYENLQKYHQNRKEYLNRERYHKLPIKLTKEQVGRIYEQLKKDASYGSIIKVAKKYKIHPAKVSKITFDQSWSFETAK
jgi:hypothetical protein